VLKSELGPTGRYPLGKLGPEDQGETGIAIGSDLEKNVVFIHLGVPTTWIAFPADQARQMAAALIDHADRLTQRECGQ
jgi:hypothetical protein